MAGEERRALGRGRMVGIGVGEPAQGSPGPLLEEPSAAVGEEPGVEAGHDRGHRSGLVGPELEPLGVLGVLFEDLAERGDHRLLIVELARRREGCRVPEVAVCQVA